MSSLETLLKAIEESEKRLTAKIDELKKKLDESGDDLF